MSSPDWAAMFAAASDEVAADRRAIIADTLVRELGGAGQVGARAGAVAEAARVLGLSHRQSVQRLLARAPAVYADPDRLSVALAALQLPIPTSQADRRAS